MRRYLWASIWVVLYLLFCAKSCDNGEQNEAERNAKQLTNVKDSIISSQRNDSLSNNQLTAYESEAIRKCSDLFDYLNILTDTSTPAAFKEKTKGIINGLFLTPPPEGLGKFAKKQPCKLAYDSIFISKSLEKISDSLYKGVATCIFTFDPGPNLDRLIHAPEHVTIGLVLMKKDKQFGDTKLRVWSLFLNDIAFE